MCNYIAYYRVSTKKQSLGLDAQSEAVARYISTHGGNLLGEYSEKESGKRADRIQLLAAIDHCKQSGATLIIAKLDRLSRDLEFVARINNAVQSGSLQVQALDLPEFNTLSVGMFATLAQHEREIIGKRTKSALEAKAAQRAADGLAPSELDQRGKRAAGDQLNKEAARWNDTKRAAASAAITAKAQNDPNNIRAWAFLQLCKGNRSYCEIARALNETGAYPTPRGGKWSDKQLRRLEKLFEGVAMAEKLNAIIGEKYGKTSSGNLGGKSI